MSAYLVPAILTYCSTYIGSLDKEKNYIAKRFRSAKKAVTNFGCYG